MKPKVLIVDDEKVICEGLARLLSKDYKTYKALNGFEAIDILSKNKDIDVMLCDIKMPAMDGNELIEKLRVYNKDIYIIVVTAAASPHKVCDAIRRGANSYISKPCGIKDLEMTIRNAVKLKNYLIAERFKTSSI
jgi:two-component system nitrogen regulation response regulator NtrX